MTPEIKVSVIVPVYNAEQHLHQCLDSIVNQTLREIEIICVDDGSTDNSLNILKEYAAKDSRVKVLTQQNQYAGVARNNGLAIATGEYLAFWDSDDYFMLDALEKMYNQCKTDDADLCICGGKRFLMGEGIEAPHPFYLNVKKLPEQIPFSRTTYPEGILNITSVEPWNKLYRRSFVMDSGIRFQGVRNGNDIYFVACMIALANTVTVVNEALVVYRKNQGTSLVGTLSKSPMTPIHAWMDVAATLQEKDAFPEQSFANKALGSMRYLLNNLADADAFREAFIYLQQEGLKKLHLTDDHEPLYYQSADRDEYIHHLCTDTPEAFAIYSNNMNYVARVEHAAGKRSKNADLKKQKKETKKWQNKTKDLEAKVAELTAALEAQKKENQQLASDLDEAKSKKGFGLFGRK